MAASAADADAYRSQLDASRRVPHHHPVGRRPRRWRPSKAARTPSVRPRWRASPPTTCACAGARRQARHRPAPAWATSASKDATVIARRRHPAAGGRRLPRAGPAFRRRRHPGLQNAGGVRVDVPAGDITVGKVYPAAQEHPHTPAAHRCPGSGRAGGRHRLGAQRHRQRPLPYTGGLRFSVDMNQARGSRRRSATPRCATRRRQLAAPRPGGQDRLITNNFTADGGDRYDTLKAIPAAQREDTFLDYGVLAVRAQPLAAGQTGGRPGADARVPYVETPGEETRPWQPWRGSAAAGQRLQPVDGVTRAAGHRASRWRGRPGRRRPWRWPRAARRCAHLVAGCRTAPPALCRPGCRLRPFEGLGRSAACRPGRRGPRPGAPGRAGRPRARRRGRTEARPAGRPSRRGRRSRRPGRRRSPAARRADDLAQAVAQLHVGDLVGQHAGHLLGRGGASAARCSPPPRRPARRRR